MLPRAVLAENGLTRWRALLIGMLRAKGGRGVIRCTEKTVQRAPAARPGVRGSGVRTRSLPGARCRLVRTRATKPRVQPSLRRRTLAAKGHGPGAPSLASALLRSGGGSARAHQAGQLCPQG